MKKAILYALSALTLAACSSQGQVDIKVPADFPSESNLVVSHITMKNIFDAKSADDLIVYYDTLQVVNGSAAMNLDATEPTQYIIQAPDVTPLQIEFYADKGDKLSIDVESFDPMTYAIKGTPLMEDLALLGSVTKPIMKEYAENAQSDDFDEAKAHDLINRYDNAIKTFVAEHPKSQAIPFAIVELSGDDFKAAYDAMTPEARSSMLMPFADSYNQEVEKMIAEREAEQAQAAAYASGTIDAPNFTLPDLNGKMVSLSDFRGKFVVLDFWGSWCGWCIKGFPALKEAYAQYGDKITVIGIDCNDTQDAWRAAVKQYDLPWIQLYNGDNRQIYSDYNIEGFPTKVIINPEGKIVDLTTGEDPSFFIRLANFVK